MFDDDDDITSHDMWCGTDAWSNQESFEHYFCGKGAPVTLEEVGLVDSVTEHRKNEKEQTIKRLPIGSALRRNPISRSAGSQKLVDTPLDCSW